MTGYLSAPGAVSNEQAIATDLSSTFGLNQAQVAGFLGNFQTEANFNPGAYNPNENAHGFAQWEGGRWAGGYLGGLSGFSQARGLDPSSASAQIQWLNAELAGPYHSVLNSLAGVTDPQQAAYIVSTQYEGNTPSSIPARQANAQTAYSQLTSGQPLTGGGSVSAPAASGAQQQAAGWLFGIPGLGLPNLAGGAWNPLNWPNDIVNGVTSTVGRDIGQGIEGVIRDVAHPLYTFLLNAFLVVGGAVVVIIALVMLAHSDDNPNTGGEGDSEGGAAHDAELAAAA
jgi:hypothetical protein